MSINPDRLAEVMAWSLKEGAHKKNNKGNACVLEAVAYVAGRPWTDAPPCVSPVIASFMRSWNDDLPSDAERDRLLKPLIPKLIATVADEKTEERRSYMALDWLIRVHTPKWLDMVPSLHVHAQTLRDHEEIADIAGATAAGEKVRAAWAAARAAAWAAAGAAARAAAWAAAWDAARAGSDGRVEGIEIKHIVLCGAELIIPQLPEPFLQDLYDDAFRYEGARFGNRYGEDEL